MWSFYLDSLRRNPFLHLLFITDIALKESLPENMSVLKSSLCDFYKLVEDKLKISIPDSAMIPYKICELKPAMGYLFPGYIKDYEYWAFGDIDLIYGDLQRFLKKPLTENADVISFHQDWISGAFTVVKNSKLLNELFLQSPDFIKLLMIPECMNFDECGKKFMYLREGMTPEEAYCLNIENDILCWTTLVHRLANKKEINLFVRQYIKELLPYGEIIDFRKGKVIGAEIGFQLIEYAIFHYLHYKRSYRYYVPNWKEIPDFYHMSPAGIFSVNQLKWYDLIKSYRYCRSILLTLRKFIMALFWRTVGVFEKMGIPVKKVKKMLIRLKVIKE